MKTLQAQAEWVEINDRGEPVLCVTNTVQFINPISVWLLWGSQDRPEQESQDRTNRSDWQPLDVPVTSAQRERPEIDAFEEEYAAYQALLPLLAVTYRGRFVAIHDGLVVDSDTARSTLVRRFLQQFGDSSVYIGYVGEVPISYQVTPFQL